MIENLDVRVTEGGGNVFADHGMPEARERKVKAQLSILIESLIDAMGWSQTEAAQRVGVKKSDVSNRVNGRRSGYCLERLLNSHLGQIVEICVTPAETENETARVLVTF